MTRPRASPQRRQNPTRSAVAMTGPILECMRQGDRHGRHDHEYREKRAAQKRRPPDQILHVLGRSLEAEAEGRGQDAQLKNPGDEVLKHGSSLRNATSLGKLARTALRSAANIRRVPGIIPMMTPIAAHPQSCPGDCAAHTLELRRSWRAPCREREFAHAYYQGRTSTFQ